MREELSEVFRSPLMWAAAGAAFCISAGAILLVPRAKEPISQVSSAPPMTAPEVRIAARPATSLPPVVENTVVRAEELPAVKIRPLPPRQSPPALPGNGPLQPGETEPHEAVAGSIQGGLPGEFEESGLPPLDNQRAPLPGELPTPAPVPPVATAPIELPRAPEPPVRTPEVTPPAPARQPERPVQRPRLPTGLLTIFFDADSSTFDGQKRRMPLRVEVWVDGSLKARSSDPEKRDLEIGLLPAGWHEVEVVPYVGKLPSQPRRRSVLIEPGTTTEYRAVLRREDGMGCVAKFRPRG